MDGCGLADGHAGMDGAGAADGSGSADADLPVFAGAADDGGFAGSSPFRALDPFVPCIRHLPDQMDNSRRQMLVDISMLVKKDDKSGIQRVVRSVLRALLQDPPEGYWVRPVWHTGGHYAYAHRFTYGGAIADSLRLEDEPVAVRPGDMFLGLDLNPDEVPAIRELYLDLRLHGVQIFFLVYDLLPLTHPEAFDDGARPWFVRWLETVAEVSDGLVCISRAVADELLSWLERNPPRHQGDLQVGFFHLGADIEASLPTGGIRPDERAVLAQLANRPGILMVGTLEPRKRHAQALAAFELLWQQGEDVNLVIVGKEGWKLGGLAHSLRNHPESGKRLFWLESASDEALQALYGQCSALLAASVGEGFGLPLIEAAQKGLPVIARDLPVFREVGGRHASYFSGGTGADLARALAEWLALHRQGQAPQSDGLQWLSWAESTRQLWDVIGNKGWYRLAPTRLV